MNHHINGVSAAVTGGPEAIDIHDFEIDAGLALGAGETSYLPDVASLLAQIDPNGLVELRAHTQRSAYKMILARFGFIPSGETMVRPPRGAPRSAKVLPAASTFETISGTTLPDDVHVQMANGEMRAVVHLEVGDELALGGLVTSIMRGRMRDFVRLGPLLCGAGSAVRSGGIWARAADHPTARAVRYENGMEASAITTANRLILAEGLVFADFHETASRADELQGLSDQALALLRELDEVGPHAQE